MRDKIISGLNELLEIDHDSISEIMTLELIMPISSELKCHPCAYRKQGVVMANALTIISSCLDECEQIVPVFEDGVIQRFE